MDYIGKVCPYCKTEFKEGDDVVFCSLCEMPHHKECWIENKACTTFGCTGTILGADQTLIDKINEKECPNCGTIVKGEQKFCHSCGAPVEQSTEPHYRVAQDFEMEYVPQPIAQPAQPQYAPQLIAQPAQPQYAPQPIAQPAQSQYAPQPIAQPAQPQYAPQPIAQPAQPQYALQPIMQPQYQSAQSRSLQVDKDLVVFLESNEYDYAKAFAEMDRDKSIVKWKHPAFWLGPLWFAYRKMFPLALAYVGASITISAIPLLGFLLQIALWVCSGLFGMFFYKKKVEAELKYAKTIDNEIRRIAYLKEKGGTNVGLSFAIAGIAFVSALIFTYGMGV